MAHTKIKTSDYSSEESPENKNKFATQTLSSTAEAQQKQSVTETRTSTTVITKSKKIEGGRVATSTPKDSNYVTSFVSQFASRGDGGSAKFGSNEIQHQKRRYKEHSQNILNTERELSDSKNKTLSGFLGNSFGDRSLNLDASNHIAYLEYKKAGEYWK